MSPFFYAAIPDVRPVCSRRRKSEEKEEQAWNMI